MNDLEVGMYVKTKDDGYNGIAKVIKVDYENKSYGEKPIIYLDEECIYENDVPRNFTNITYIEKYSNNLIDLIEVDDYVNGYRVDSITEIGLYTATFESSINEKRLICSKHRNIYPNVIKTILTKEQYESMVYEV